MHREEMCFADLNPVVGSEQGGRPVWIIQHNQGNRFSPTVIVAPIASTVKKTHSPIHILLPGVPGIAQKSIVLLEQIGTIDKPRLKNRIACIDDEIMRKIDTAIQVSVGFKKCGYSIKTGRHI